MNAPSGNGSLERWKKHSVRATITIRTIFFPCVNPKYRKNRLEEKRKKNRQIITREKNEKRRLLTVSLGINIKNSHWELVLRRRRRLVDIGKPSSIAVLLPPPTRADSHRENKKRSQERNEIKTTSQLCGWLGLLSDLLDFHPLIFSLKARTPIIAMPIRPMCYGFFPPTCQRPPAIAPKLV
jgi:hypothetical protein